MPFSRNIPSELETIVRHCLVHARERALKQVVLHRKNAHFFKTPNGAHVGISL